MSDQRLTLTTDDLLAIEFALRGEGFRMRGTMTGPRAA